MGRLRGGAARAPVALLVQAWLRPKTDVATRPTTCTPRPSPPSRHPAQLPMCGLYADGEIGPEIWDARSALRWAGPATPSGSKAGVAARSKLQGFTTIVTSLAAAGGGWPAGGST